MRLFGVLVISALGCSSANFDVVASSADADVETTASPPDDTASPAVDVASDPDAPSLPEVASEDAPKPVSDTAVDPPDVGCARTANPTTIFVDPRNGGESSGSAACPLPTLAAALSLVATLPAGTHEVRLAAGTASAPMIYDLPEAAIVRNGTRLVGADPTTIVLKGGGTCGSFAQPCVMAMEGNTSLEGVTLEAAARVGLAIAPLAGTTAVVKNVVVQNGKTASAPGVLVAGGGSVDLGPDFKTLRHAGTGLLVQEVGTLRVLPAGNAFDDCASGIVVQKGVLSFGGGEVLRSAWAGITLSSAVKHTVQSLVARDNIGPAILVDTGAGLKLRGSTIVKNRVGVLIRFGTTVDIDLGTTSDPGKNVLGGATEKNNRAAICFPSARNVKLPASGNRWPACAPGVNLVGGLTCDTLTYYTDVFYTPLFTSDPGAPLDPGACDIGP